MHVHTVYVTLQDPADVERIAARMQSMNGLFDGMRGLSVVRNEHVGAHSCHLALTTQWTDLAAYEAYHVHPAHKAVADDVTAAMAAAVTLDHTA